VAGQTIDLQFALRAAAAIISAAPGRNQLAMPISLVLYALLLNFSARLFAKRAETAS
jgi:hypothetical protein